MTLRKWYALLDTGNIQSVGEHADFFGADEAVKGNYVWLFDQTEWDKWVTQVTPAGLYSKFNEKQFLENLLLDENREAYAAMTPEQRTVVRLAYGRGWVAGTFPKGEPT